MNLNKTIRVYEEMKQRNKEQMDEIYRLDYTYTRTSLLYRLDWKSIFFALGYSCYLIILVLLAVWDIKLTMQEYQISVIALTILLVFVIEPITYKIKKNNLKADGINLNCLRGLSIKERNADRMMWLIKYKLLETQIQIYDKVLTVAKNKKNLYESSPDGYHETKPEKSLTWDIVDMDQKLDAQLEEAVKQQQTFKYLVPGFEIGFGRIAVLGIATGVLITFIWNIPAMIFATNELSASTYRTVLNILIPFIIPCLAWIIFPLIYRFKMRNIARELLEEQNKVLKNKIDIVAIKHPDVYKDMYKQEIDNIVEKSITVKMEIEGL